VQGGACIAGLRQSSSWGPPHLPQPTHTPLCPSRSCPQLARPPQHPVTSIPIVPAGCVEEAHSACQSGLLHGGLLGACCALMLERHALGRRDCRHSTAAPFSLCRATPLPPRNTSSRAALLGAAATALLPGTSCISISSEQLSCEDMLHHSSSASRHNQHQRRARAQRHCCPAATPIPTPWHLHRHALLQGGAPAAAADACHCIKTPPSGACHRSPW
jgi:hypothetical protein